MRTSAFSLKFLGNAKGLENHEISITASGGVAITSESGNASDVINKADERLYDAKKSGRDKFVIN